MRSDVRQLAPVPFPEFLSERIYMVPFLRRDGLPAELTRWQPTVDAMLGDRPIDGTIYLMIDQGHVEPGVSHRRPGLHVDGYWSSAGHGPKHQHRGACDQSIVLASDAPGGVGYVGDYEGEPGPGGEYRLDTTQLRRVELTPGFAWAGHALHFLHESVPAPVAQNRTLVRLNVPYLFR